ncbi:DUF3450 domain-containing protein [Pelagicoccus mobilis]|uniref:DUF3450 domain-containing protein n=1 Tax=Pelagicoccus mobilis TaxID=415221 RepID=A0A934RS69_9BACT|nr:DUF3450 domain-containing protein [Pelagicoccus mobilis]MBK1875428.1 DUF3450 domain-containing protein [Pelagicoccus mobilis]
MTTSRRFRVAATLLLLGATSAAYSQSDDTAKTLRDSVSLQESTNRASNASQTVVDQYSEKTRTLLDEYRLALREIENLEIYNAQMQKVVDSQQEEMDSLTVQLDHLEDTKRGIVPLMQKMIAKLDAFVKADAPFLPEERAARIANLASMMDSSQFTDSEKYRRILEAYQIEMDYGRNIEVYQGELALNGTSRTVDFLRFGRIGLYYQTLDKAETGLWNPATRQWEILDNGYNSSIDKAMAIARKQAAPALTRLPISAAEEL